MADFVWTDLENAVPGQPGSGSTAVVAPLNAMGHEVERLEDDKVDKETGKGLSTNDFTDNDKDKLDDIEAGAQVNTVDSVAGKTGAVVLTKGDVGLSNVDNTRDSDKPISTAQQFEFDNKQNTLVSGENIKTINGESVLGSGDLRTKGQWEWLGESTNDEVVSGLSIISDQVDLTHKYRYFRIILDVKAQTSENTVPLLPRIKLVNKQGISQGVVFQSFSSGSANIPKVGAITIFDIDNTSELVVTHMYQQGVYINSAGTTPHTTWDTIADISGLTNIAGFYIDITDNRYPGFATGCKMTVYGKE